MKMHPLHRPCLFALLAFLLALAGIPCPAGEMAAVSRVGPFTNDTAFFEFPYEPFAPCSLSNALSGAFYGDGGPGSDVLLWIRPGETNAAVFCGSAWEPVLGDGLVAAGDLFAFARCDSEEASLFLLGLVPRTLSLLPPPPPGSPSIGSLSTDAQGARVCVSSSGPVDLFSADSPGPTNVLPSGWVHVARAPASFFFSDGLPGADSTRFYAVSSPFLDSDLDGLGDLAERLVANERTVSNELVRQSFVWDPTEPVATRPLAWFGSNAPPRLYTHDGNKNVSEVVAVASGTNATVEVVAHYDYAAFGAVIAQKGDCAEANPWRFSSEYEDTELGLDYYNYREYESMVGRWLGYDFVADCLNRYVWCENYTGGFDFLGLKLKVFGDHEQKEKIIKLLQEIFGGVVQLNGDDVVFQGASDSLGCECKKLICEDPTYSINFDDKADMYGGGMFKPEPFGGVLGGGISLGSKDSYSKGNELVINRAFPFVHLKEVIEDLDDILAHELAHAILHQQQKPNADQKLLSGDPAKNKLEKEARRLTDYVRKGCHK